MLHYFLFLFLFLSIACNSLDCSIASSTIAVKILSENLDLSDADLLGFVLIIMFTV